MSNKYWRILLLISVLLVTRPASVQGTVSLAPSTTIPVLSTYTYLADGTKYKIIDAAGNGRSYIGPFCLAIEKSGSGSSAETKAYLESIEKDGGRILAIEEETGSGTNSQRSTSYTTLFFIKDHLGSIRAVTDAQGHILERNAYYPFGLQTNQNLAFPTITTSLATLYPNSISSLPARRDLYNGKEIQTAAGTDYLDYGFRQYDPTAARWFNIDPMAEKYSSLTPYNYCKEAPIYFTDYRGLFNIKTGMIEKGDNLIEITKAINNHFRTNLSVEQIAEANNIDDVNRIFAGNKIILPGQYIYLVFNLKVLKVKDLTYDFDYPDLSWIGTSGREGYQDRKYQSFRDKGPIPEGEYIVDPSNTQSFSEVSIINRLKGMIGFGTWPGLTVSWGYYRTWIIPTEETNTYDRYGFSIHGGAYPGSAGCIDLTSNNDRFHTWLKAYNRVITLRVVYP